MEIRPGTAGHYKLRDQAGNWPTPRVRNHQHNSQDNGVALGVAAGRWPTPTTPTGGPEGRGPKAARGSGGGNLKAAARDWPTPTASLANDREEPGTWKARAVQLEQKHHNTNGAGMPLTVMVKDWPTPKARDVKGASQRGIHVPGDAFPDMVAAMFPSGPPAPTTPKGGRGSSKSDPTSLRLSPAFVEWLMGLPPHHTKTAALTASESSEMQSYRSRLRSRYESLLHDWGFDYE